MTSVPWTCGWAVPHTPQRDSDGSWSCGSSWYAPEMRQLQTSCPCWHHQWPFSSRRMEEVTPTKYIYCQVSRRSNRSKAKKAMQFETINGTFILRILSVNLRLNSKMSFGEIVLLHGSLLRILYFPHEREWSTRAVSSSERFSCVAISEKLSFSASLNSKSSAPG